MHEWNAKNCIKRHYCISTVFDTLTVIRRYRYGFGITVFTYLMFCHQLRPSSLETRWRAVWVMKRRNKSG